jgi:hypothetical protein
VLQLKSYPSVLDSGTRPLYDKNMIELLILWNVAAARADQSEDTDATTGVIVVWAVLQILIWPVSMWLLLWKRLGVEWAWALGITSTFTSLGLLIAQDSFYWVVGFLASVVAFSLIAKEVVSDS